MSAEIIAPTLKILFNTCIEQGIFPDRLKIAELTPIFKKGDKLNVSNWRPISLLSPFSKLFEIHLHTQLTKFINKHNILHPYQYGFRRNSSTEQAITQITDEISANIQDNFFTCSVFIDLTKAFDTIDHSILMSKLNNYGIRGIPAKLFLSYLTNRKQKTKINNIFSNSQILTCGIPQGSILGPEFFNIYINDLPKSSLFSVRLFADDAYLTLRHNNPDILEHLVNQELIKTNEWIRINKLTINYKKTNFIIFFRTKHNKCYRITMNNNLLERVTETRYLGVYLDEQLNWQYHLKKLKSKIAMASYILIKSRKYLDLRTLKMLYYSTVYPHITYCVTAWGGISNSALQPIIKLQKKIIRYITFSTYTSPSKTLFIYLNFLPFNSIYKLNMSILMYKIQNNLITGSYNLTPLNKKHKYNTRLAQNSNFYQNFQRTKLGQSTCSAQGLRIWRQVPVLMKSLPLHMFKKNLKQYLINSLKEEIT